MMPYSKGQKFNQLNDEWMNNKVLIMKTKTVSLEVTDI